MALLSIDMIREIRGIADTYEAHERERVSRVNAAAAERAPNNVSRPTQNRVRPGAGG